MITNHFTADTYSKHGFQSIASGGDTGLDTAIAALILIHWAYPILSVAARLAAGCERRTRPLLRLSMALSMLLIHYPFSPILDMQNACKLHSSQ